jgi:uncharacterized protein
MADSPSPSLSVQLMRRVRSILNREKYVPLKVSIMGQTGVGKSSLINALFNANLDTDPVRPASREITLTRIQSQVGGELLFYDLPGLGESKRNDSQYIEQYKQMLLESDIVLWAIHADSRSFTFDFEALQTILDVAKEEVKRRLVNKITFVLTKADMLTPSPWKRPPWILAKLDKEDAIFLPQEEIEKLLELKEKFLQDRLIFPHKDLLVSQTYHDGDFKVTNEPNIEYKDQVVSYKGFLDKETLVALKKRYPLYEAVFDRIYDNYRVISCSSLFRFNLDLLLRIIIAKLGEEAITRFSNFYTDAALDRMPFAEARKLYNFIVLDEATGQILFDPLQNEEEKL